MNEQRIFSVIRSAVRVALFACMEAALVCTAMALTAKVVIWLWRWLHV